MLDKPNLFKYVHCAALSKIIYSIHTKSEYNDDKSFIDNVKKIVNPHSKITNIIDKLFLDDIYIKYISSPKTGLDSLITINKKIKKIYVTFRGTEKTTIDTLYNFIIIKKHLDHGIFVHNGYWRHLTHNDLHMKIIKIITDILQNNPDFTIDISGHSLGGGLSLIFSYILINEVPSLERKINTTLFGTPNISNKKMFDFLKSKNINVTSFIYKNDFVTSLFPGYYEHFPRFLLNDCYYYYLPNNKSDYIYESHERDFGNNIIKDHDSKNYPNSLISIYERL